MNGKNYLRLKILQNIKDIKIPFDIQPEMKPKYNFQKFSHQEIEAIEMEIENLRKKYL